MFNYDWWHGPAHQQQTDHARLRCVRRRFAEVESLDVPEDSEAGRFLAELEAHTILYLRDGFSYEMREPIETPSKSYMTCEVVPVEEAWQTGAFIVSLPYDDIVRVEVFAIHPSEKPSEVPHITGFRAPSESGSRD